MTDDEPGPPRPPPIELELADVPRHHRRGPSDPQAPSGTMAPLPGAPAAAGPLPEAPLVSYPGPAPRASHAGTIAIVLTLVVGAVLGVVVYRRLNPPNVTPVRSPYRSFIGKTVDLPGAGWKRDRRLRKSRSQGAQWMRFEALFRGRSIEDPDDLVMVFRVFAEGAFAAKVNLDELRRQAQLMTQALGTMSSISGGPIDCFADTAWRTEPAARCRGTATILGQAYLIGVSIWQPTTEDLVGVFYVSATLDSPDFETIVRSMQ